VPNEATHAASPSATEAPTTAIGRTKVLFDEVDVSGTGSVSRSELFAKLKADTQLELLLDMKDVSGEGMLGVIKMGAVLKKLDSDGDGSISWAEFEVAFGEPNVDEDMAPALSSRAKALFDAVDTSGTGSVSRSELFAKLKADKQLESLLDMQDVGGKGMLAVMKMGAVLKKLDSDGDGSISWAEFEAAMLEANPDEGGVVSALSKRAKALFDAVDTSGTGSVSRSELFAKLKADKQLESLLDMKDVSGKGMLGVMKMGAVLKKLDSDGDGSISWAEFEAAMLEANPDESSDAPAEEKPVVVIKPAAVDSPALPPDPRKKALLFAMDYYQCAAGWKVINGTANDVGVFTNLLTNTWGFDPANQTIVSERTKQTTAAMHQAFDDFTATLQPGDIVALYYSGHGDRVFDEDGDEVEHKGNTVIDSFDEGICTVDGHLIDDRIKEKLDAMLGKGIDHVFWFVDACYSGGFVERGTPNCVVLTSSTDKEKSEDGLRMEKDEVTGRMEMFYQGTGTRWLQTVMSELYAEGGSGAATSYQQLFDAIQAQRAGDSRKKVQHPTLVASERMRGTSVLLPAVEAATEAPAEVTLRSG